MWVRQCDLDSRQEAPPPIPARIASNEEFIPPPQSPQQKEYEARAHAISVKPRLVPLLDHRLCLMMELILRAKFPKGRAQTPIKLLSN